MQLGIARDVQTIGHGWRYESGSCVRHFASTLPFSLPLPTLLGATH